MSLKDFLKRREADLNKQEENFNTKLPVHAATLGILPAEVTSVTGILTDHITSFTNSIAKKAESKAAVKENLDKKGLALDEFRRIAKKIKASTGYTEAIGEELGIIGPDVAPSDYRTVQPKLKGDISGEVVHIYFDKFDLEGLKLFSQRGAETDYSFLANDTHSPYTDNRKKLDLSKPEERRYYAYYTMDEDEVGLKSDILTVVVP